MSNNEIIPPEVLNDQFYFSLIHCASRPDVKTILEIGSSSGEGSTEAFVQAIRQRPDSSSVKLYGMEISQPRFERLCANYKKDSFVKPYRLSSVSTQQFPSKEFVINFYHTIKTNLNSYPVEKLLSWLEQDLNYITQNGLDACGIEIIKKDQGIEYFDMVLIDGSEFTGFAELHLVFGAKIIALDDINAFKNFQSYQELSNNPHYKLIARDVRLRNGFAIFERVS